MARETYEFGGFRLDPARRRLNRKDGGIVELGPKAFDLLVYLLEHAGEPVPRKTLLEALWPDTVVEENNLTQAVSALRRTLGKGHIATLPGRGYQFVSEVRSIRRDAAATGASGAGTSPQSTEPTAARTKRTVPIRRTDERSPPAPSSGEDMARSPLGGASSGGRQGFGPLGFGPLGRAAIGLGVALAVLIGVWTYLFERTSEQPLRAAAGDGDAERPTTILVLPFDNLSPDPEQRAFSDGLTDELIVSLQRLPGLRVTGRTTSFALRGSDWSVPEVAAELGVQYVFEAGVRREGDRLRVRGQLSDAAGFGVWPYSYEGALESLFDVQDEIVRGIAEELRATLGLDRALRRAGTENRRAYELYLAAQPGPACGQCNPRAIELLDQALQIDQEFVEAWTKKSQTHSLWYVAVGDEAELAAAEMAAERAIELAPDRGDGYAARATVLSIRGDWLDAESDYREASALGANETDSRFLLSVGNIETALEEMQRWVDADPLNGGLYGSRMLAHELLGDHEETDALYQRGERLFGQWIGDAFWVWIRLGRGDVGPGYEELVVPDNTFAEFAELLDDPVEALALLNRLAADPENQTPASLGTLAVWAAYFGDSQLALRLLREATSDYGLLIFLAWLPVFDDVRQLPGFKEHLIDIGLVDYWRATDWPDVCRPSGTDFECA